MTKRLFLLCLLPAFFFSIPNLFPQNCLDLKIVAHVDPAPPSPNWKYSEVTGVGDLAILAGFTANSNVWIYEVSNKTPPVLLAAIPINTPSWDVQVHGRYLFIALTGRMEWYDIINPTKPQLVNRFSPTPAINPHTFFVVGNTLYIADYASSRGIRIFNIADKKNPKELATISETTWTIHDMTIIRNKLYGAWISKTAGLLVSDVSNPAKPKELARLHYPNAATHNAWPTEDEQYILTTDEVAPTRNNLKIWDARTPGRLMQVAEYTASGGGPASTIHNVYVRGKYAYISYYCEGVRIVDIADPANPKAVAFCDFNTSPSSQCPGYGQSNWGIYPFANLLYASDLQQGLYVMEFTDHPPANLAGQVINAKTNQPVAGAMVYFLDEFPTTRSNAAGEFGMPWFKNDTVRVVTDALGYRPDTSLVITSAASPTALTIRLKSLTTDVTSPDEMSDQPAAFALLPAYPNPFSSSISPAGKTKIPFHLTHPENVQLEVFNIFGQRVRRLFNARQNAGTHRVLWNGADEAGQRVAAGIYLVHLRAGRLAATQKITVVQ